MSKTPPVNEVLNAKIAAHMEGRPSVGIAGPPSILSLPVPRAQNAVAIRKPTPARRRERKEIHADAIRRLMRPRQGDERKSRLEAMMLWILGNIDPATGTKADALLTTTMLAELQALLDGEPSRIFQPVRNTDADGQKQGTAKITGRLWQAYAWVAACGEIQWRQQSEPAHKRSYDRAFLKVVEDIETDLAHGEQMDDLMPVGKPSPRKRSAGVRTEEKSVRDIRRGKLATRCADYRRALGNGSAPMMAKAVYSHALAGLDGADLTTVYRSYLDAARAALLIARDGEESHIKKLKLSTGE